MGKAGKGIGRVVGPLIGVGVFCAALFALHRELSHLSYGDVASELRALPTGRVLLALLFTALNYWVLTGYDVLALRYLRRPLPYRRVLLASFTSYSFSNNVGLAMLGASAVRYRFYSLWGFSVLEVGAVVAFCMMTTWLGVLAVAGASFILHPPSVPAALHLPFSTFRPLGIIFLAAVAVYLLLGLLWRRPIIIRGRRLRLPDTGMRIAQALLASADWVLVGLVFYMLLPAGAHVPLAAFVAIFLAAQVAGFASTIPGGLGAFEFVLLLLLKPYVEAPQVVGSLLAFRAIYYLLPLCAGALAMGAHEALLRRQAGKRLAVGVARWGAQAAPPLFAAVAFLAGVVLLFSSAMPAASARLAWLGRVLALPVVEASHFLGSLVGAALLLVSRGLQRRIDAAYAAAVGLLAAGVVLSLARGLRWKESLVLALMLAALVPCRREFYRRASLFSERFSAGWVAAVGVALLSTVWLGLFVYRHVQYSQDLWWRFSLHEGDASRFLRGMVGATALALMFALARLLRPAPPRPEAPEAGRMDAVRRIVDACPRSYAALALLGDKSFLFSPDRTAFIMFATQGRSWIALGDPVGPEAAHTALAWQFLEMVDRSGGRTVFYNVGPGSLPLYVDLGLALLKIGEEARVDLRTFSLEGPARGDVRRARRRLHEQGCTFEVAPLEAVPALLGELRAVSDAWLEQKHTREKGFAMGSFRDDYLSLFPAALLRQEGRILAFSNVWTGARREEISPDLVRHLPEAPPGTMDCLLSDLMLWGQQQGYLWFDLGNAPLAGIEARAAAPLWNRLGTFVYRHGAHFYNFEGLRAYKQKFDPLWEPRYLALPGSRWLPQVLADLTALTSGGVRGIVAR